MSLPALNHTQISNAFIDKWMPEVSPEETKIFLAISRATIGWHKETDDISLTQMQRRTGMSRNTCIKYAAHLEERGLINRKAGAKGTTYSINYDVVSGSCGEPVDDKGSSHGEPVKPQSGSCGEPVEGQSGSQHEHTKERVKEKEKRKSAAPLIEKLFRDAGSDYYRDAREMKAAGDLSDRYFDDPTGFTLMVMALGRMRAADKFYRGFPLCPSTLNTFWNKIKEYRIVNVPQPAARAADTTMADGRTTKEYLEQCERERKERCGEK